MHEKRARKQFLVWLDASVHARATVLCALTNQAAFTRNEKRLKYQLKRLEIWPRM